MNEKFEKWLNDILIKDNVYARNCITLLRYKLKYHEPLTAFDTLLFIAMLKGYILTYDKRLRKRSTKHG